jgi:predicted CXXCH cytochrome family protein
VANYPLWNRVNPGAAGFTLYSGLNMQSVSFKSSFTADSTSLFCMSCHDGVTKISAVYNAGVIEGDGAPNVKAHAAKAGAFYNNPLGASASTNLTKDLSKTHPVNFQVVASNNSQADLNVGTGSVMGPGVAPGYGYAATETFPLFKTTDANGLRAGNRSLECGSCHAVHDSLNSPFLRYTMTGSRLCLGCHNK